jgi:hypothetical protein
MDECRENLLLKVHEMQEQRKGTYRCNHKISKRLNDLQVSSSPLVSMRLCTLPMFSTGLGEPVSQNFRIGSHMCVLCKLPTVAIADIKIGLKCKKGTLAES